LTACTPDPLVPGCGVWTPRLKQQSSINFLSEPNRAVEPQRQLNDIFELYIRYLSRFSSSPLT
jgi:hypothetical protein